MKNSSQQNDESGTLRNLEIQTSKGPEEPLPWWARLLQSLIPSGNNDLESFYPATQTWWLEVDEDGAPQREIGFDSDMRPIVVGLIGENVGFLIDASDDWSGSEQDSTKAAAGFESAWQEIFPRFSYLDHNENRSDL